MRKPRDFDSALRALTGKTKADFTGGNARYISYVNVFQNEAVDLNADDFVRVGPDERQTDIKQGDVLFTASSETAAETGMSSVVTSLPAEPIYLNSFCFGFRPAPPGGLLPEFSKHLFRSTPVRH